MKTIIYNFKTMTFLMFAFIGTVSYSQEGINYQGVARDANNELLVNVDITLDINIVKGTADGNAVYSEIHNTSTDVNGVFSVVIGKGIPAAVPFWAINWAEDKHFLNVWLNGTELGTTEFVSVPYANAIGKWQAHKNGVTPKRTGGSIYVGDNAGALDNLSDNNNIGIGKEAMKESTDGFENIAIGTKTLSQNQTEYHNIAIGDKALRYHNDGRSNLAIGSFALGTHTSGDSNVAIGESALDTNLTGEYNVAIGARAGGNCLGSGNVFIGPFAGTHSNFENVNNKLIIDGYSHSNPLIYGDFYYDLLSFNAKVGIGTQTPEVPLQIVDGTDATLSNNSGQLLLGSVNSDNLILDKNEIQARNNGAASILFLQQNGGDVYVGNAIVHASDRRLKRDVDDISFGLKEVLKLEPKEYFWKGKEQEHKSLGLIAQDVNEIIKNVVTYNKETDKYGISYTELIPVLIKAIQEQQEVINDLKAEVNKLKTLNKFN